MRFELGIAIAERSMEAIHKDGRVSKVDIQLGMPKIVPDSTDVYAPYQIQFKKTSRLWYAVGIDGFQALQLAMKMIAVEIESLERDHDVKIRGYHGS